MSSNRVAFTASFDSENVKRDGTVNLRFRVSQMFLSGALPVVIGIDKKLALGVKDEGQFVKIGAVRFESLRIDRGGEGLVTFASNLQAVSGHDLQPLLDKSVEVIVRWM